MKVTTFISHQKNDTGTATAIAERLKITHGIGIYLDCFDNAAVDGPALANHLKNQMGKCNNLIAVVSEATKDSWWVPWEIGVASEKNYPLATYAVERTVLPGYLKIWPYLRNNSELDVYAKDVKAELSKPNMLSESAGIYIVRKAASDNFFTTVRRNLGQS